MFNNPRYATQGVISTIPPGLQALMWSLVETMRVPEKDFLQVFRLTPGAGIQHIRHTQEQPPYEAEYDLASDSPLLVKVFVIDDGDHSTMLLAEEY